MSPSKTSSPPRKRGAQPGNHNAFKHGYCRRRPKSPADPNARAQRMLELQAEEEILDELIVRTLRLMDEGAMSPREWNSSLRVLAQAIGRKESIYRTRKLPASHEILLDKAIDELKIVRFEQD